MYKILIAIDGSEHSEKVLKEAITIAEPLGAAVTILTVIVRDYLPPSVSIQFTDDVWETVNANLQEEAETLVAKSAAPFKEKGLEAETKVIFGRKPPSEIICEEAKEGKYNLVMLGSHGLRGFREALLGSVSNKVAHCLKGNVMIVK